MFNIVPKIPLQLRQPPECVIGFDCAQMFVVSLSGLIVITHHADIVADKRKPVFEIMRASGERLWKFPDNQFYKADIIKRNSFSHDGGCFHVGVYDIACGRCQLLQQTTDLGICPLKPMPVLFRLAM
jgi:hypothetical protein